MVRVRLGLVLGSWLGLGLVWCYLTVLIVIRVRLGLGLYIWLSLWL